MKHLHVKGIRDGGGGDRVCVWKANGKKGMDQSVNACENWGGKLLAYFVEDKFTA